MLNPAALLLTLQTQLVVENKKGKLEKIVIQNEKISMQQIKAS